MKRFVFVVALLGGVLSPTIAPAHAATPETSPSAINVSAIDGFLRSAGKRHGVSGMALGIVEGDRVVHLSSFGQGLRPQTPMVLASVSKPITATALMQLVDAGLVDLDAPARRYVPELRFAGPPAADGITVRQLLNHTSGMPVSACEIEAPTLDRFIVSLRSVHLDRAVGQRYEYCSGNYNVIGSVIEHVSGLSFGRYVEERVFAPLAMTHSHAVLDRTTRRSTGHGHQWFFGLTVADDYFNASDEPGGYLVSSAEDMTHFLVAHLNDGRYGSAAVLSPRSVATMHAPSVKSDGTQHYGLGWVVGDQRGVPATYHYGANYNVETFVVLEPTTHRAAVLIVNTQGILGATALRGMEAGLATMLAGRPAPAQATSVRLIYVIVDLVLLLLLAAVVRGLRRVPAWRREPGRDNHRRRAWVRSLTEIVLGALVIGGLRFVFVQLGADWFQMFRSVPDLVPALMGLGVLLIAVGVARAIALTRKGSVPTM